MHCLRRLDDLRDMVGWMYEHLRPFAFFNFASASKTCFLRFFRVIFLEGILKENSLERVYLIICELVSTGSLFYSPLVLRLSACR